MKTLVTITALTTLVISSIPAEARRRDRDQGTSCPRVESKGEVAWTRAGAEKKAALAWRQDVFTQFGGEAAQNMVDPKYTCSAAGAQLRFRQTCRVVAFACKK